MSAPKDDPEEILDDLESIRDLLDEGEVDDTDSKKAASDETDADSRIRDDTESIPILDDVVDGGISINESPLGRRTSIEGANEAVFDTNAIDALLGDEWRKSAAEILEATRADIEAARERWSPQDTDELNEALKIRIDQTVDHWLAEVLAAKIGELRTRLTDALKEEARALLEENLGDPDD